MSSTLNEAIVNPFRRRQLDESVPPEDADPTVEEINSQLSLGELDTELQDEINQLHKSTTFIHDSFLRLEKEFAEMDKKEYKDTDGKLVPKLRPMWRGYHNRYRDMIWRSKETATRAAAYVSGFVNVHVPGIEDLIKDLQNPDILDTQKQDSTRRACEELKRFSEKPNPMLQAVHGSGSLNAAQYHANTFETLKNDLALFEDTVLSAINEDNQDLTSQVANLRQQIERLNNDISSYEAELDMLGIPLGATERSGSHGILSLLKIIAPKAVRRVLVAVLGARSGNQDATSKTQKKLSKSTAKREELEAQLTEVGMLSTRVKAQREVIGKICKCLAGFETIWGLVAFHATSAEEYLMEALDSKDHRFFLGNLRLLRTVYCGLYHALKSYATLVDRSGVAHAIH